LNSQHSFLAGGDEMGALMREHDWRRHPLGTPDTWPSTLKTLLRLLLSSNHPMFIWWGEDLIQFYNDAYRQSLGPERHPQALGQPGRECWAEAWHLIGPDIERVMAGGSTWHEDRLVPLTRNGVRDNIWWTYGYSPIEDEGGIRGVLVICKEVTEEHLLRERLEQTNHALIETMDEGFCLIDMVRDENGRAVDYEFVEVNRAFSQQTGLRDCVGRRARELVPQLEQRWIDIYDEIAVTGEARRFVEGSAAMGRWFSVYARRIAHPNGRRVALLFADITERMLTEQALRDSEAKFRTIADAMPQMIWSATPDGRFDYANEGWRGFAGVAPETLHGAGWKALADPAELPALHKAWFASQDGGAPFEIEHHARHHSGEWRWVLTRALPVRDEEGRILRWMGTMTDIHEQKTISEELRLANSRKDEFLAMLAHELRNPLAPIRTGLDILRIRSGDAQATQRATDIMERQLRQMVRLVDDLLDVSRINTGKFAIKMGRVELKAVVNDALEVVRSYIELHGHELVLDLPDRPVFLHGDATRLAQILSNLLNNAAKYTNRGGRVTLSGHVEDKTLVLEVLDTGIGLAPEMLDSVFDMFVQVDSTLERTNAGLGVGLSLARKLVELHGGTITARSEGLGRGSCFSVRLPIVVEPEPLSKPTPAAFISTETYRILLADDNVDFVNSIGALLTAMGHSVVITHNGPDALAAAARLCPDYAFLDIGLPQMSGYDLARGIRKLSCGAMTALIAVTGWGQEKDRQLAFEAGFDHHMVKPVRFEQIEEILGNRSIIKKLRT